MKSPHSLEMYSKEDNDAWFDSACFDAQQAIEYTRYTTVCLNPFWILRNIIK